MSQSSKKPAAQPVERVLALWHVSVKDVGGLVRAWKPILQSACKEAGRENSAEITIPNQTGAHPYVWNTLLSFVNLKFEDQKAANDILPQFMSKLNPFAVVFEPASGKINASVKHVSVGICIYLIHESVEPGSTEASIIQNALTEVAASLWLPEPPKHAQLRQGIKPTARLRDSGDRTHTVSIYPHPEVNGPEQQEAMLKKLIDDLKAELSQSQDKYFAPWQLSVKKRERKGERHCTTTYWTLDLTRGGPRKTQ